MIESIEEKKPDPATGLTYDRVLVPYYKASELLKWGDVGAKQIETAFFIAKKRGGGVKSGVNGKNLWGSQKKYPFLKRDIFNYAYDFFCCTKIFLYVVETNLSPFFNYIPVFHQFVK